MRRLRPIPVLALILPAVVLSACGSGEIDAETQRLLDQVRRATEKYKDVRVAERDGYAPPPACSESEDGLGAMGLHYTSAELSRDPKVDLLRPERLLYEPRPGRSPVLVGVEYFVKSDGQRPPETAFGRMDGPMPPHMRGQPTHFDLHVWIYRKNSRGVFDIWNPDVRCTGKIGGA